MGTTGIVEPMSEKALLDTIKVDIDKRYAENPERILIAPSNYRMDFCKTFLVIGRLLGSFRIPVVFADAAVADPCLL